MRALGYIVSWIIALIGGTLLSGWVFSILWGWFIVSTFHAQPITLVGAIGVTLVVRFLTTNIPRSDPKNVKTQAVLLAEAIGYAFVAPLLSLGLGWIVHLFI